MKDFFFTNFPSTSMETSLLLHYESLKSQPRKKINGLYILREWRIASTISQLHVSQVPENIPKDILLIHYMDDCLLAYLEAD